MQPWHLPMTLLAFCRADCVMLLMPTKPSSIHNWICVALPAKGITAWVKHSSNFTAESQTNDISPCISSLQSPPKSFCIHHSSLRYAELAEKNRSSAGLGPKSPRYVFLVAVEARFRSVIPVVLYPPQLSTAQRRHPGSWMLKLPSQKQRHWKSTIPGSLSTSQQHTPSECDSWNQINWAITRLHLCNKAVKQNTYWLGWSRRRERFRNGPLLTLSQRGFMIWAETSTLWVRKSHKARAQTTFTLTSCLWLKEARKAI